MFKILCLFALVALVAANEVTFKDCAHHEVTRLDLSDCSGDFCTIHKGHQLKLAADFVSNQDTAKVEIHITAKVGLLEIAVPGVEKNGCHHTKCPLAKGEKYTLDYTLDIPKTVPDVKAHIIAKLVGDHGILACINVNGEVKK